MDGNKLSSKNTNTNERRLDYTVILTQLLEISIPSWHLKLHPLSKKPSQGLELGLMPHK